jgi:uncharacterized protein YndB with AHSA1/START domain
MTNKATIELTKKINAPASTVFQAIKEGMLFKSTGIHADTFKHDFREGGKYSLRWTCVEGASCSGKYIRIEQGKLVQFTWHSLDCEGATNSDSIVTVSIVEHGGTTELKLVHEGLDAGVCHDDHLKGWTTSLVEFITMFNSATLAH